MLASLVSLFILLHLFPYLPYFTCLPIHFPLVSLFTLFHLFPYALSFTCFPISSPSPVFIFLSTCFPTHSPSPVSMFALFRLFPILPPSPIPYSPSFTCFSIPSSSPVSVLTLLHLLVCPLYVRRTHSLSLAYVSSVCEGGRTLLHLPMCPRCVRRTHSPSLAYVSSVCEAGRTRPRLATEDTALQLLALFFCVIVLRHYCCSMRKCWSQHSGTSSAFPIAY